MRFSGLYGTQQRFVEIVYATGSGIGWTVGERIEQRLSLDYGACSHRCPSISVIDANKSLLETSKTLVENGVREANRKGFA
jgi:hypothetical protein